MAEEPTDTDIDVVNRERDELKRELIGMGGQL